MLKYTMYCDGGSRGNPGVAGSGTVIYDEAGKVVETIAHYLGTKFTNNVAEYQGLINGLEAAARRGCTHLDVYMDSNLVVKQMQGSWKAKHPDMQAKLAEAKKIATQIPHITYTWVPREKNKKADELANLAMDERRTIARAMDGLAEDPKPVGEKTQATAAKKKSAPEDNNLAFDFDLDLDSTPKASTPKDNSAQDMSLSKPEAAFNPSGKVNSVKIVAVRHGQTDAARDGVYSGSGTDIPLNAVGLEQVKRAARYVRAHNFKLDALIASPMIRTQQTAKALSDVLDLPISTDKRIIEIDFGEWENQPVAKVHNADPTNHGYFMTDVNIPAPGGESAVGMYNRVKEFRDYLLEHYNGKTVVLATHSGPTRVLLALAANMPASDMRRFSVETASVNIVEFWSDGGSVVHESNGGKVF